MPTQNIHVLQEIGTLEDLYEVVAKLQKTLKYLINGNLDFENLRARSIKADNIEVGSLTAEEIAANTITADKMLVNELSAITAKLGKITSGEIYGTYIATNEGTYPRAEMNNTSKHFRALASDDKYTEITTAFGGAPAFHSTDGETQGFIQTFTILGNTFIIGSTHDIDLRPGTGRRVSIPSWSQVYSEGDHQTLATALNNLATAIDNAATKGISTGLSGGHNHGIPDGTQLMKNGGGTVTWSAASSHTHEQS